MESFNLKNLNKKQYRAEISNRFTALENLDAEVDINRALETIRQNNKISVRDSIGYYEMKNNKP
jgi:hypothetical protein